jgi:hypothetical protein
MKRRPLNTRQKKFIENHIVKGMSIAESVRLAGYTIKSGRSEDFSSVGCRLLKTPRVSSEVERIREREFNKTALSYAEKRAFLARSVRTSVDQVGASSDLAQEFVEEVDVQGNVRRKVKVVDKLRAIELDNKMSGDNFADRSPQASNPFLLIVSLGKSATPSVADQPEQVQRLGSPQDSDRIIEAEVIEESPTE